VRSCQARNARELLAFRAASARATRVTINFIGATTLRAITAPGTDEAPRCLSQHRMLDWCVTGRARTRREARYCGGLKSIERMLPALGDGSSSNHAQPIVAA